MAQSLTIGAESGYDRRGADLLASRTGGDAFKDDVEAPGSPEPREKGGSKMGRGPEQTLALKADLG